ncbi:MAG TPA: hypothetical protein VM367_03160 [Pseudonocardia sp.]|nr:hypothetical protein [Pseudonocardia sp.]
MPPFPDPSPSDRHRPELADHRSSFALPRPVAALLRRVGLDRWSWVRVHGGMLDVRFGPWRVSTPVDNVAGVEVAGPYAWWKALGARLSLVDRGLTFGTSPAAGVCIRFHRPVRGLDPFGLLRHPGLTVTVDDPAELVRALEQRPARVPG